MNRPKDVDEYISSAPKEVQSRLEKIREIIKSIAPEAEEKISYGMPYYYYKGRLGYFAYAKHHIGLYALFPDEQALKTDLKDYSTSKGTIRFPLDKPLPTSLIKKLLKTRLRANEAAKKN